MSHESASISIEPLRERIPHYAIAFGIGCVVAAVIGTIIAAFTDAGLLTGAGYGVIGWGVALLLVGGTAGGGYANMGVGAAQSLFGGRTRYDDEFDDADVRRGRIKKVDASSRLKKGLRPQANPSAFWQVIGGLAAMVLGIALLSVV